MALQYWILSNLYGPKGVDDGDEETIHRGRKSYANYDAAGEASERLGIKYPNAICDVDCSDWAEHDRTHPFSPAT